VPKPRQRLADLNLALHAAPPVFWFFKTADLPPEQDFPQGQETDRASGKAFDRQKPVRLQRALIQLRREIDGSLVRQQSCPMFCTARF
jgi:type VI protein secretion system component VasK